VAESDQQALYFEWFRLQFPQYDELAWSSPNSFFGGGQKNKWGMIAKFKKEGWVKGIPDVTVAVPASGYHGLYLEFKDVKKTESHVTPEQKAKLKALEAVGYRATWCAGFEEAKKITLDYFGSKQWS